MCFKKAFHSFSYKQTEFPAAIKLIFQTVFVIFTTLITLYFVPHFEQKFEVNQRKSVFFASMIDELNTDTKDLLGDLSILVSDDVSLDNKEALYINIRKNLVKLHWRSVEFGMTINNKNVANQIKTYQNTLTAIEQHLIKSKGNYTLSKESLESFALASANLLLAIGRTANVVIEDQQN